jgi:hypothetical protein
MASTVDTTLAHDEEPLAVYGLGTLSADPEGAALGGNCARSRTRYAEGFRT